MDATRITYIEEANELLSNLETALLSIESKGNDRSNVEAIFRVMHTLKGNSSMFGLTTIAEFVHDLETIYDKIRCGEMTISRELLDCTFACLDHLKVIVLDPEMANSDHAANHKALIARINGFIQGSSAVKPIENKIEVKKTLQFHHIYFRPSEDIFDNGTNPLYLVSELCEMGQTRVLPHLKAVSSLEEFNESKCICSWDIFLKSEKDLNEIKDVFVFVEDRSIIEIKQINIPELFEDLNFIGEMNACNMQERRFDAAVIESKQLVADEVRQVAAEPKEKVNTKKDKGSSSIRVASDKLDELMNLVSELVTTQAGLSLYTNSNKNSGLETISENIEKVSRRLRDIAFGMTLVPINNLFSRFQRMVRDVSANLGKEIEFITEGGETELDKTIIETLTDPLMHMLRNSLDHGIERPEDREMKGKSRTGKLVLRSYYSGVFVYIQISDDGKGIDVEAVRQKAISRGLLREDEEVCDKELFDFIFHPGFSTAQKVTDVSGRGVGMDVVKRNIADIKGSIAVDSKVDEGTTLTIKIPLTLSIIDGLLVNVEKVNYIIPLSAITKCFEVNNSDMIDNFNQLLVLDEEQVPFVNLRSEFGHPTDATRKSQIIVVHSNERKVGLSVDHIIGEHQAVVKPLGKYYKQQDFISGASILGDGTISLVMDTNKIIELSLNNKYKKEIA